MGVGVVSVCSCQGFGGEVEGGKPCWPSSCSVNDCMLKIS